MSKKVLSGAVAGRPPVVRQRVLQSFFLVAMVVLPVAVGTGMLIAAFMTSSPRPPQPPAAVAPTIAASPTPPGTVGRSSAALALAPSEPVRITISKIGVAADVIPLGTDKGGYLEVPPLEQAQLAGWYRMGPTPGETGNAVIVGHVDSYTTGPAVFFALGDLRPGDIIEVTRKDKMVVRFRVDSLGSYPKTAFPTELVYAPSGKVGLRLVTCGGQFDDKTRSYSNNVVVFATLASWQLAP